MRYPSYPIGVFKFKVAFLKDLRGLCPLIGPSPVTHVLTTRQFDTRLKSAGGSDSSRILARTALAASILSLPVSHSFRESRNFLLWMEPNRMGRKKRGDEEELRTPIFAFSFLFLFAASHMNEDYYRSRVFFDVCTVVSFYGSAY